MRAAYGSKWQRLASNALNGEIKTRVESYKSNLDKAFETDSTVENNLDVIKPQMKLLQLSKNELTAKMPKSKTNKASSEPCVKNLESTIGELNELKKEREQLIGEMTAGLESAELKKDLFAVYQGNLDKKTAFENHLGNFSTFEKQVEEHQTRSGELLSSIDSNMVEFSQLTAGATQQDKVQFFQSIDEGLKTYYDNMNLLSNGAKFYKQMHQYLASLHLYINDFATSRNVEKDDMMQQLNGGGSGYAPPGGQPGTPYNPAGYMPQSNYGGGKYQ
jgi:chromosome segregation ATPase